MLLSCTSARRERVYGTVLLCFRYKADPCLVTANKTPTNNGLGDRLVKIDSVATERASSSSLAFHFLMDAVAASIASRPLSCIFCVPVASA